MPIVRILKTLWRKVIFGVLVKTFFLGVLGAWIPSTTNGCFRDLVGTGIAPVSKKAAVKMCDLGLSVYFYKTFVFSGYASPSKRLMYFHY